MDYRAKRFIRLFHDYVGLTPKLFCRIQRFQSVLDQIAGGEQVEWGESGVGQRVLRPIPFDPRFSYICRGDAGGVSTPLSPVERIT